MQVLEHRVQEGVLYERRIYDEMSSGLVALAHYPSMVNHLESNLRHVRILS